MLFFPDSKWNYHGKYYRSCNDTGEDLADIIVNDDTYSQCSLPDCWLCGFGERVWDKNSIGFGILPVFLYIFEEVFPNHSSFTGKIMLDGLIAILIIGVGQALLFCVNASSGGWIFWRKF